MNPEKAKISKVDRVLWRVFKHSPRMSVLDFGGGDGVTAACRRIRKVSTPSLTRLSKLIFYCIWG